MDGLDKKIILEEPLCQSCACSLDATDKGSEADGSISDDYCEVCYQEGKFTDEFTMKEMIEKMSEEMIEKNRPTTVANLTITIDEARSYLRSLLPTLKRWQST
ncbi:MAG: zinc ribbon domain-containing protein [Candidatus Heimdallarchaeaceae archaeon]|jgi:predicted metal-binding protein